MTVIELLDFAQIPFDPREKDNVYIECPYCASNNLSVNVFTGAWHCWSASCERKGAFHQLAEELDLQNSVFTPSEAPVRDKRLSEEERSAIVMSLENKPEIIEFCAKRKLLSEYVMEKKVIGYDKIKRAYVFPFRNERGELIGAKYRGDTGSQWIHGEEPLLYIPELSALKAQKTVIVEGEIDAISLCQYGIPAVATLGAGKDKGFKLLGGVRQYLLGYDMDSAGEGGVEKASTELGRYRCKRVHWTAKDPNDMLLEGKERADLILCLKNAQVLKYEEKGKSLIDTMKEYMTMMTTAPKKRYSWGYPVLDSFTKGIGGGMFIGVLAEAGTGKTTFAINAAVNLAKNGVGVGIASLEEHPINEVTPKMVATALGRNPHGGLFSEEEIASIEEVIKNIRLYDEDESVDNVIEWMRQEHAAHGTVVFFVDYLQLMVKDEKDVQQIKEICYRFKKLTKEIPEICIVMVIQPKQKQKMMTKEGVVSNENLDGSDARGGAAINQSVDAFLTIKTVAGNPNQTEFRYTKVRGHHYVSKRDWIGRTTRLEYNHDTMRQTEVPQFS